MQLRLCDRNTRGKLRSIGSIVSPVCKGVLPCQKMPIKFLFVEMLCLYGLSELCLVPLLGFITLNFLWCLSSRISFVP